MSGEVETPERERLRLGEWRRRRVATGGRRCHAEGIAENRALALCETVWGSGAFCNEANFSASLRLGAFSKSVETAYACCKLHAQDLIA